jgi:hypothetical protein
VNGMERTGRMFFLSAVLAAVLWVKPFCPASADGGGMSLPEEIGARIGHVNGLPAGERLSIPEEVFDSSGLDKVVLGEDDLREIEEYRETMKKAGFGPEQIEEAVKGFELAKKMNTHVFPGPL